MGMIGSIILSGPGCIKHMLLIFIKDADENFIEVARMHLKKTLRDDTREWLEKEVINHWTPGTSSWKGICPHMANMFLVLIVFSIFLAQQIGVMHYY